MTITGNYRTSIYVIELETVEYIHDLENPENSVLLPGLTRTITIYSEKEIAERAFEEMDIYAFYSMYNLPDIEEATLKLCRHVLIPDAEAQFDDIIAEKDLLENIDWKEVNDYINKGK